MRTLSVGEIDNDKNGFLCAITKFSVNWILMYRSGVGTIINIMKNYVQISLVLLFALGTCGDPRSARVRRIVGGSPAGVPPYDDPIVYVRFAGRSAKVRGVQDFPHFVFRGIRYADPTTGRDRFQRPRQHFLNGDIDATMYPPPCLQPIAGENRIVGSEDCLFLNVFTPDLPLGTEGLPVVVWIHGGGFRYGSASQYGVRHLVGKRLVIVTIQYRLGSLGFLGTGTQELPGNSALWDMVMAVQWVRNHIGFFGGNPYQIVVMGHGTGASSALLVALNDVAKGYTKGVVALSGTAVSHWAVDNEPDITAKEVADLQGCPTVSVLPMIKCLQAVSAASIIRGDSQIEISRLQTRGFVSGLQGRLGSIPGTEGRFDGRSLPPMVEGEPLDKLSEKRSPKIPLLTGITRDETKSAIHGQYEKEIIAKLQSVPHFLDEVLVKNLQSFTGLGKKKSNNGTDGGTSGLWNLLDPLQFRNYISVAKNDVREGLSKISEITADALFNLPAFLTADLWSKNGAPAFLYRFEHCGKSKKAHHFLKGLPIIGNHSISDFDGDTVGHGDDLAYLFEARTLEGEPIVGAEDDFTDEDKHVRDIFTGMISTFAKHGKLNLDDKEVPHFSSETNNYVQINAKPKSVNNFRFCQMALWAGLTQRLQSATCKFLNVLDSQIKNVGFMLFDTVNKTGSQIGIGKPIQDLTGTKDNVQHTLEEAGGKLTDVVKNPLDILNIGGDNKNKHEHGHGHGIGDLFGR